MEVFQPICLELILLYSIRPHLHCEKVPHRLSLLYPSLYERSGGFGTLEEFAPTDNRQTSLSEAGDTHTQYQ